MLLPQVHEELKRAAARPRVVRRVGGRVSRAVVAALLVALLVELRDAPHSSNPPSAAAAREHRDADSAAALAGPRQRAELAPCPHPGGQPGSAALRDVTAECAADGSVVKTDLHPNSVD